MPACAQRRTGRAHLARRSLGFILDELRLCWTAGVGETGKKHLSRVYEPVGERLGEHDEKEASARAKEMMAILLLSPSSGISLVAILERRIFGGRILEMCWITACNALRCSSIVVLITLMYLPAMVSLLHTERQHWCQPLVSLLSSCSQP